MPSLMQCRTQAVALLRAPPSARAAVAAAFALLAGTANAQGSALAPTQVGPMPVGWFAAGVRTGDYAVGADRSRLS